MKIRIQVRQLPRKARHGLVSLAALCLTGVLAPIACSSDVPVKQGAPGSAGTSTTGGGATVANGGSATAAGTNGSGSSSGGSAGAPASPVTCPECAESGLTARPTNTTCVAGDPPPTNYKFGRVWAGATFSTALGIVPMPDGKTMIVAQKNGIARAVPIDPSSGRRPRPGPRPRIRR